MTMGSRRRPTIAQSAMIDIIFLRATTPMANLLDAFRKKIDIAYLGQAAVYFLNMYK